MKAISRRVLGLGLAAAWLGGARPAWAGSYLNRAALLLRNALQEAEYLRARVNDLELARIVHELAQTRLDAAGRMTVPKEVVQAHPHLLLVLENFERSAEAAEQGKVERFLVYHQRALDEDRTFRSVLKQLGWSLPEKRGSA
jgi:hypothetical protein